MTYDEFHMPEGLPPVARRIDRGQFDNLASRGTSEFKEGPFALAGAAGDNSLDTVAAYSLGDFPTSIVWGRLITGEVIWALPQEAEAMDEA